MESEADITALLASWQQGSRGAFDHLFEIVHGELRQMARRQIRRLTPADTLTPTALVNEAFVKLVKQGRVQINDRVHFLAIAATAMRHILINDARHKRADRRGGAWQRVTFEEAELAHGSHRVETLIAVHEALEQLSEQDPRLGRLVELRFFGGLTEAETAAVLGVNERTVRRDWRRAKALLSLALATPSANTTVDDGSG